MLRQMTAKRFRDWMRYAEVEPFRFDKELRADYRIAHVVQTLVNLNRGKSPARPLKDFLLPFDDATPKKKTWQEMQRAAYMIAMMYNVPGVTS
jgi:hypothetical protein